MRLTKSNPTGGYSYLSDGVSPASDVLSDGYSAFTPGISEINGAGSRFYLADAQGNSRGLLDAGQGNPDGYNWDAFGNAVSRLGTNPTAYAWNEESGYQSDNDSGLKLLRHRYYDSWTGRFLSQDPAGDGDNWYGYCGNDPMDEVDPAGLMPAPTGAGMWGINGSTSSDAATAMSGGFAYSGSSDTPIYNALFTAVKGTDQIVGCFITGLAGTIGGGQTINSFVVGGDTYRRLGGQQEHGTHVHKGGPNGPRYNREGQEVDGRERPLNRGNDVPKRLRDKFKKGFDREFPPPQADDAPELAPFTRWLANRSDADLLAMSVGVAGLIVGSYYISPLLAPVAGRALVPLLAP